MKITIDEAIKDIKVTSEYFKTIGVFDNPANKKCKHSLDMAIDTMRKYQKIQEIFERYDKGELTHNMFGLLVGEVLEDETDD